MHLFAANLCRFRLVLAYMQLRAAMFRLLRQIERYTRTDMVYLAKSAFWSNAGTLFVTISSFLLYVIFNHYVPKDAYGTYQYLLSMSVIIGAFTLTGMNSAVTRAVARGQDGALHTAIRAQLRWAAIPFLGSLVLGCYYLFQHNPILGWGMVLISIFVPLNNTFNTYAAFLQGKKDFRRGFYYSLWWNVPYYICVAIAAIFFKAALVLLAANLIAQTIGLFIAYRKTITAYKLDKIDSPEVLTYGKHLSAMGLFGSIASQIDTVLAFHFLGAVPLAIYSFATAIPDRLGSLFKFLPAAALPRFAERSPREIRIGLARRLFIGTLIGFLLAGCYALVAHFIFALIFPAYLSAVEYSQWYALALGGVMNGVIANALAAAGNMRALYKYNIISPLVSLALVCGGIIFYGLAGLIAARIIGSVFTLMLGIFLYWTIE